MPKIITLQPSDVVDHASVLAWLNGVFVVSLRAQGAEG